MKLSAFSSYNSCLLIYFCFGFVDDCCKMLQSANKFSYRNNRVRLVLCEMLHLFMLGPVRLRLYSYFIIDAVALHGYN